MTGSYYYNLVNEPDIYRISVVNDYFCQKQGATTVSFKPCPTARIHAENFSCCEGEPLPLYGSLAPNTNISYMWDITGTGYHETFNTPDIVFTPTTAGTYAVTLTVTDNAPTSGCSSTTQTTVTAVAKPAAPSLYFPGDSCIGGAPVTVAATSDEVTEVVVMDMHGRRLAAFKDTDLFNIKELPAGSYIVRVKTRRDKEAPEEVNYLKLVKK